MSKSQAYVTQTHTVKLLNPNFESKAITPEAALSVADLTGPSSTGLYKVTIYKDPEFIKRPMIVVTTPIINAGPAGSNLARQIADIIGDSDSHKRRVSHAKKREDKSLFDNVKLAFTAVSVKAVDIANKNTTNGIPIGAKIPLIGVDEMVGIESFGESIYDLRGLLTDLYLNVKENKSNSDAEHEYAKLIDTADIFVHTASELDNQHLLNLVSYDKTDKYYKEIENVSYLGTLSKINYFTKITMPEPPVYDEHLPFHVTCNINGEILNLPFSGKAEDVIILLHHGTDREFEKFDVLNFAGQGMSTGNGYGVHTTPLPEKVKGPAKYKHLSRKALDDKESTGEYIYYLSVNTASNKVFEADTKIKDLPAHIQINLYNNFPEHYNRQVELHATYKGMCHAIGVDALAFFKSTGVDVITGVFDDARGVDTAIILNTDVITIKDIKVKTNNEYVSLQSYAL